MTILTENKKGNERRKQRRASLNRKHRIRAFKTKWDNLSTSKTKFKKINNKDMGNAYSQKLDKGKLWLAVLTFDKIECM